MASYSSYKKIKTDSVVDASIPESKLEVDALKNYSVKWIYGALGECSAGCCCLWTVPSGVRRATFELWGAGGNGHGACSCNRCHHYAGAQGGYYNSKTISVTPGDTYTVCAGGVYPCCQVDCYGCFGCVTYVNGTGLSNFCALGGDGGCANTSWSTKCFSTWGDRGCVAPVSWDGDFAMGNHRGGFGGSWNCHCYMYFSCSFGAPFLGGAGVNQRISNCWIRCGCWTVPYGHGGQGAMTDKCGRCCGQGGMGGSGVVRITYF